MFTAACYLSVFRPPHSLCWGSLLGTHPQHLAAGDPGKIHPGTAWGRAGTFSGSAQKERDSGGFWGSPNAVGKRGERCTPPPVVWLQMLVCYLNFICFVGACWLSQEDLAEHRETCVNYYPAVLQLLLHCGNVDTQREPLSPSTCSGRLAHDRKRSPQGLPPGGQSRKEGSSPGIL